MEYEHEVEASICKPALLVSGFLEVIKFGQTQEPMAVRYRSLSTERARSRSRAATISVTVFQKLENSECPAFEDLQEVVQEAIARHELETQEIKPVPKKSRWRSSAMSASEHTAPVTPHILGLMQNHLLGMLYGTNSCSEVAVFS